jgi:hypothetical protein
MELYTFMVLHFSTKTMLTLSFCVVHSLALMKFWVNDRLPNSVGYFVIRLYTTRIKSIITLLSLHVSALLGHHQVTNVVTIK